MARHEAPLDLQSTNNWLEELPEGAYGLANPYGLEPLHTPPRYFMEGTGMGLSHLRHYGRQLQPVLLFDCDQTAPDWQTVAVGLERETRRVPNEPLIFGSPFPTTGLPASEAHESYLKGAIHSMTPAFHYEPAPTPATYSHNVLGHITKAKDVLRADAQKAFEDQHLQRALQLDMRKVGADIVQNSVQAWWLADQIGAGLEEVYGRHPDLHERRVRLFMKLTGNDVLLPAILRNLGIPGQNFTIRANIPSSRRLAVLSDVIVDTSEISRAHYKSIQAGDYAHYTSLLVGGES